MDQSQLFIDNTIDSLMYKHGKELEQAIEKFRKDSIKNQAENLIDLISNEGRCPICTLKLPCKHFKSPDDVPEHQKSCRTSPNQQITTPSSNNSFHCPTSLVVRFRGKSKEYPKSSSPKTSEFEKLKIMEKLEKYKEEKLLKEIQQIEDMKKYEELSIARQKQEEKKRNFYYSKQKEKLVAYQKEIKIKMDLLVQRKLSQELQNKMNQNRAEKLQQEKRQLVSEYRLKKRLFDPSDFSPELKKKTFTRKNFRVFKNSPLIAPSKQS